MSGVKGSRTRCGLMRRYRIYNLLTKVKQGHIAARSICPALYFSAPKAFLWKPHTDIQGCEAYIDALVTGRQSIADYYEKNGYVYDIVLPEEIPEHTVKLRLDAFVDYLLLRGEIDIPLGWRLNFLTNGGRDQRLVPRDYIAAMTPLLNAAGRSGALNPADDWHRLTGPEEAQIGKANISLGMYREPEAAPADAPMPAEGASAALPDEATEPAEIEVRRRLFDRHADLLTKVLPAGQTPFYARRLIDYRGHLLWAGSSWAEHGPWRVSTRDASRMLALGISEPA